MRAAIWCAARLESALPVSLSEISRKRTIATESIGTMTIRTKKRVSRARKLMGRSLN